MIKQPTIPPMPRSEKRTEERTETHACDSISRQEAIALADHLKDDLPDDERIADLVIAHNEGVLAYQTALSLLPSARTEIIRCKDCKHRPTPTRADEGIIFGFSVVFPDEICPCQCEDGWYNWYPKDDFYCGFAERREDPEEKTQVYWCENERYEIPERREE